MPRADFALCPVQRPKPENTRFLPGSSATHAHPHLRRYLQRQLHLVIIPCLTSPLLPLTNQDPPRLLPFAEPLHTRLVPSSSVWLHSPLSSPISNASSLVSSLAFPSGAPGLSRPQSLGRTTTRRRFCSFASPLLSLRFPSIRPVEPAARRPFDPVADDYFLTSSARARCISHSTRSCAEFPGSLGLSLGIMR